MDSNNNPISLNELDNQAASFWNVPVDSKTYAKPFPHEEGRSLSWFNSIGHHIAYAEVKGNQNWDNVALEMLDDDETLESHNSYTAYYINLINYWKSLGYTPVTL
jgi:hypothetical protein